VGEANNSCKNRKTAKEIMMSTKPTIAERVACMTIGTALSIVGLILIALGLTFLPIIGILVAFPVLGLAFYFFKPGKWVIADEAEAASFEAHETGAEESMAA
jgi:hypothetical protein